MALACEPGGASTTPAPAAAQVAGTAAEEDPFAAALEAYAQSVSCSAREDCWINPRPGGEPRHAIAGSSADDLWFAGDGDALHFDGAAVRAHATPLAATYGLWSLGADDVWAVGRGGIAHWDGTRFSLSRAAPAEEYRAVWGASARDVYAIGRHELVHWDGQAWSVVPDIVGTQVSGSGSDDVWVAGDWLWHFDGRSWSRAEGGPSRPIVTLAVLGRDDVWAAGQTDANDLRHFDGAGWRRHPLASGVFVRGVAARGASDLWLLGNRYDGARLMHHDGARWTELAAPTTLYAVRTVGDAIYAAGTGGRIVRLVGGPPPRVESFGAGALAALRRTWGTSATDLWAVGERGTALRFDGQTVHATTTNVVSDLADVGGTSPDDVWAVGRSGTILHWTGSSWTRVPSASKQACNAVFPAQRGFAWVGALNELLRASHTRVERFLLPGVRGTWFVEDLDGTAEDDIWAVGSDQFSEFAAHYDGKAWSPVQPLRTTGDNRRVTAVVARARNDVWVATESTGVPASDYVWRWDGWRWTKLWLQFAPGRSGWEVATNAPRFDGFTLGPHHYSVGSTGTWLRRLR